MKRDRIGIILSAPCIQHRCQIRAAAEPGFRGAHEPRVHVYRRHMRTSRMNDHRYARGPETRVDIGARNLRGEFRRERSVHGRGMNTRLLEDRSGEPRHGSAAPGRPAMIDAIPTRLEETRRCPAPRPRGIQRFSLDDLERIDDALLQCLEPDSCGVLPCFEKPAQHDTLRWTERICRRASPATIAAAIATLRERKPGSIGTRTQASAATCTSSGTPADSRPTRRMSPGAYFRSV